MIVGENARGNDMNVNAVRSKQLTNFRSAGADEKLILAPPVQITLEKAMEFIAEDELVEITPNHIRLRKKELAANMRSVVRGPQEEEEVVPPAAPAIRGVVLAGGSGSRLLPLTRTVNKHLLPVGREPMIYHPVRRLVAAGIRDILVVTGVEHIGDIVSQLRSGAELGCRFTYRCQDDPLGIADALSLAEDFARELPLAVLLGDNIFDADLRPLVDRYLAAPEGAQIHLHRVDDPRRFGVPRFDPPPAACWRSSRSPTTRPPPTPWPGSTSTTAGSSTSSAT